MLIRSGDTVEVRTGNAKGTRAKVLQVLPEKNGRRRIVVEGVNRVYRHIRRSQKNPQGGRLSKEMPIDASNVLVVCTACGRPSRLGAKVAADGGKSRVCKKCGADLDAVRRPRATKRTGA